MNVYPHILISSAITPRNEECTHILGNPPTLWGITQPNDKHPRFGESTHVLGNAKWSLYLGSNGKRPCFGIHAAKTQASKLWNPRLSPRFGDTPTFWGSTHPPEFLSKFELVLR